MHTTVSVRVIQRAAYLQAHFGRFVPGNGVPLGEYLLQGAAFDEFHRAVDNSFVQSCFVHSNDVLVIKPLEKRHLTDKAILHIRE